MPTTNFISGVTVIGADWLNEVDAFVFQGIAQIASITPPSTQFSLGNYTFNTDQTVGAGQDNFVLTYDNATGEIGLETAISGGNVNNSGTPLENQIARWINATTLEGGTDLTFDPAATTGNQLAMTVATGLTTGNALSIGTFPAGFLGDGIEVNVNAGAGNGIRVINASTGINSCITTSADSATTLAATLYSNTATRTQPLCFIHNDNATGSGDALVVTQDQGGHGIEINHNSTAVSYGLHSTVANPAALAARFYSAAANRTQPLVLVVNDNPTGSGVAMQIQQDQGAAALNIVNNSAASSAMTVNSSPAALLIDVQTFTASGTWTKPAGCTSVEVWAVGGGGGGTGTLATAAGTGCCGDAGGGGALSYKRITSGLGATETVTVGAGGAGATGGNNGGSGTASTFGAHLTANPGFGGSAVATGTIPRMSRAAMGTGGSIHASADWGIRGQMGLQGFLLSSTVGTQARGGASGWCPGGISQTVVGINSTGRSADTDSYGAGGNAATAGNSQAALNGGAGAGGLVIVKSYA